MITTQVSAVLFTPRNVQKVVLQARILVAPDHARRGDSFAPFEYKAAAETSKAKAWRRECLPSAKDA